MHKILYMYFTRREGFKGNRRFPLLDESQQQWASDRSTDKIGIGYCGRMERGKVRL